MIRHVAHVAVIALATVAAYCWWRLVDDAMNAWKQTRR